MNLGIVPTEAELGGSGRRRLIYARVMRVAVYTDYTYRRIGGVVYAERAFALFIQRLARRVDRLIVVGRIDPSSEPGRYPLGEEVEFVALPYYESLSRPGSVLKAMVASLSRFWRALDDVDCVWLLGPHPLSLAFSPLVLARRRRLVLGVRQDLPAYARSRHPRRRLLRLAAVLLDALYRALALLAPVVVVGPALAHRYRRSKRLLEVVVSLVDPDEIVAPDVALRRAYGQKLTVLSVGRLEAEKNPLLLADVLAVLASRDRRWRLVVCGEGDEAAALQARLVELGLSDRAELRGYVPFGPELLALYRRSNAVLHVSWTEGLPQVLTEAFASGTPVVATDVGGIQRAVGDAVKLVPPGRAQAAAVALRAVAGDPTLRAHLIRSGHRYVSEHSASREVERVARFLGADQEPD